MTWPGLRGITVWLAIGMIAGCAADSGRRIGGPLHGDLLMGRESSAPLATRIGRSPWPATTGQVESREQTYYYEFYRDYFTNAQNERNTPYRYFQSYRVGATQR